MKLACILGLFGTLALPSLNGNASGETGAEETITFTATAYALRGITASGTQARPGIVAADPDVLPPGSIIEITEAGEYSGIYRVEDTGAKIVGRSIDIHMRSNREALRFGVRDVQVRVIASGGESN